MCSIQSTTWQKPGGRGTCNLHSEVLCISATGLDLAAKLAMGRVSKHKKIKAMDPFYKGPKREPSK